MTSAPVATLAACSILPVGRQANSPTDDLSPSVGAFSSAEAFVREWIAPAPRPAIARIEYGPQYNGVGECPF